MEQSLTWAQKLSQGLITTIVGMLIVFSVLFILYLLLNLLKVVFYREKSKEKILPVETKMEPVKKDDDNELVAVISAAVYQMLGDNSMQKYNIKSFKRVAKRKF